MLSLFTREKIVSSLFSGYMGNLIDDPAWAHLAIDSNT
jgi:hypothetical protein